MTMYLWIALGSALGGVARYWSSGLVAAHFGETFPLGTLAVNVLGSFAIGFLGGFAAPEGRFFLNTEMRQFLMFGVCGGYTTFSSFSIQTLALARDGEWLKVGANIALSVMLCLVAVWLGNAAANALNQLKGP